jgi:hypothetical protein
MTLTPANPLTCRIAGSLLVALAAWQVVFSLWFGVRTGLSLALDPGGLAPWIAGSVFALGAAATASVVGLGSAIAGIVLWVRPEIGRWLGLLAALVWTPLGCGVVGLAIGVLVMIPGEPALNKNIPRRAR